MARKKKPNLGCLFWLALALLVVVVFLYNRETINRVLSDSGLLEMVQQGPQEPEPQSREQRDEPIGRDTEPGPTPEQVEGTGPGGSNEEIIIRLQPEQESPSETTVSDIPVQEKPNTRRARLFFVAVDADGDIELHGVVRSVPYDDSPLRDTLSTLLHGQVSSEITGGLLTMIPRKARLRNVYVKGDTAYIDFSDEFRFNSLGQVGLAAQVKQVVYTATEFSNVRQVQILIEGKLIEYLSSEGPFIGAPLSRERLMEGVL